MIKSALLVNKNTQLNPNPNTQFQSNPQNISFSERKLAKKFSDYLNNIEDTRILVASNSATSTWPVGGWTYYDMPYTTRWSPEYKKKMITKMYAVEDYCKRAGKSIVTLLTLTGYQNGQTSIDAKGKITTREELFGDSQVKSGLKGGWRLLSNLIAKICPNLDYIWVMEPHKSGYPHMHVAVLGYIPKELQERLTRLWSEKYQVGSAEHGIDFSAKSVKESVQSIRNYLMKYISKGIGAGGNKTWTPEEWIYHAIAWKHQHRYIGMSRTISLYCTASKLRFKFRKYMTELCSYDIGFINIPIDKQGIINSIKTFKQKDPHDEPPPNAEQWFCTLTFNKTSSTVSLIRKSLNFYTVTDAFNVGNDSDTVTRLKNVTKNIVNEINNTIANKTAHYTDQFIRSVKPQWNRGLELSNQTTII